MKKLIFSAAVLASAFFAASCQQELLDPVQGGSTVTFSVEIPEVATKANVNGIGNGADINNLVYAVYKTDKDEDVAFGNLKSTDLVYCINPLDPKGDAQGVNTYFNGEGKAHVTLELIKNQKYVVLFWAQNEQTWVSGEEFDLTQITYPDPDELTANLNKYEAFCGAAFVDEVTGATKKSVTLTRPFAQINLASTDPANYDVDIVSSSVKIENAYPKFNVATKKAFGDAFRTVEYADNANPDGKFGNYDHYVAMNYIFANPKNDGTTPVKVTCTITTQDHGAGIVTAIGNVPVAQNYKTNIVGNLLTSDVDYEVTLVKDWSTPSEEIVLVNNASGLQGAIENAEPGVEIEIKLDGDIDLSDLANLLTRAGEPAHGLLIPVDKSIVLNLSGYELKGNAVNQNGKVHVIVNNGILTIMNGELTAVGTNGGSAISNNGTLTITDAIVNGAPSDTATGNASYAVNSQGAGSKLVVNNSTINGRGAIGATKGTKVEINGGVYHTPAVAWGHAVYADGEGTEVVINDGTFSEGYEYSANNWGMYQILSGNKAKVIVNGGTFEPWDCSNGYDLCTQNGGEIVICGGSFADDPTDQNGINYVADGYPVIAPETEGGYYTIGQFVPVAKIDEVEYGSLRAAVAAVEDGETITLIADETFTAYNYYDNGGWKDGLGYSGDQSFTIDLNGFTIKQNGALNDYLVWLKNDGTKANTITFKNGTMDAGTTAYCALCTASSHVNKLTVNLENITLINKNSNGSTVKIRAGSVLNVNAGTKIIGTDSYLGIENWNAVVNIYDGAEIYMNGTTSYNGCLVGVGGNGTVNVYGGYGKGVRGGFIAMTSGGVINVEGGEWIANTDGTVGDNSNLYVLTAQNNKYESGYAGASIINVTGGTFRGGMDAWILNDVNVEKAELNISGGNFNANPESYVVNGYKAVETNGVYNVVVDPVAKIGETEYATLKEAFSVGGNVTLLRDVTITEPATLAGGKTAVLDLNGKTLTAELVSALVSTEGSDLTVKNGKVVAYESTVRAIGGKVTVESGEYTSTGSAVGSPSTNRYSLDCREGGELIINGGTFKSNNGMLNVGSTVTINGGKFENIVEKVTTRHFAYVSALLTVNDGEFIGKANAGAGGCFFCGAGANGDIQVNGGKFTSLWTNGNINRIFEVYFGGTINVTGGLFNTNGGITNFVVANTDETTKGAYPYVAK